MSSARPFLDFLRGHRGGQTHDDLSDMLQELVAAVTDENKAGSLTIKISIKPAGNSGALEVSDDIKLTKPKATRGGSIFFVSPENNLVREDPKQTKMDLQEIRAPRMPREVA